MWAEASTIFRAVVTDFFFNCWYLEMPSDKRIQSVCTNVRPLSCARSSTGNVPEFLCWKWKPYSRVVFRECKLV
jgi:hypothetical protein